MALALDNARLLAAFAHSIDRELLPKLEDPRARFTADAGRMLAAYQSLRFLEPGAQSDVAAAKAMAREVRSLIADHGSSSRLVQILEDDARGYREAEHALTAELEKIAAAADNREAAPTEEELSAYLRARLHDSKAKASNVRVAVGGYSKQTVLFDCERGDGRREALVMRRDLHVANIGTTVIDEFDILKAVHGTGFPVAEPLWLDRGSALLRGPFLVSRRLPGATTGDTLGITSSVDFSPSTVLADLLARLHAIDIAALRVTNYSEIAFDVSLQRKRIQEWQQKYDDNVDQPCAALEVGLAWLQANAHLAITPKVLVHGEVGFHNLLFDGPKVSGLLDWELAHAGSAADDLAYVRRFVEPHGPFEDFLASYVAAGGVAPPAHALTYFEVFGNVRNAILGVMGLRHFHQGQHHDLPLVRVILTTAFAYIDRLTELLGEAIRSHGFVWELASSP